MKKNSTIRNAMQIAALACISGIAIISMVWTPSEEAGWWLIQLLLSKAVSAALFVAFASLYLKWRRTNAWLAAYDRDCEEVLNAPNPLYIGKEDEKI